jgi:hypothetical protein
MPHGCTRPSFDSLCFRFNPFPAQSLGWKGPRPVTARSPGAIGGWVMPIAGFEQVGLIQFECGEGVHGDGTGVSASVPGLLLWIDLPDHRIHRRAGTMPWITPAALEQRNDTKDLSQAQRPLASGGKLVDNSVTGAVIARHGGLRSVMSRFRLVEDTLEIHGSQRVLISLCVEAVDQ